MNGGKASIRMAAGGDEHAIDAQRLRNLAVMQRIADQHVATEATALFLRPQRAHQRFGLRKLAAAVVIVAAEDMIEIPAFRQPSDRTRSRAATASAFKRMAGWRR